MATCKECLHYEACVLNEAYWVKHNADQACSVFKDKSKYVEQKHGHWIEKPNPWGQDGSHSYDCSVCGERTCVVGKKLHYCPICGAKMDGEQ